jgi:hypothetical protein
LTVKLLADIHNADQSTAVHIFPFRSHRSLVSRLQVQN